MKKFRKQHWYQQCTDVAGAYNFTPSEKVDAICKILEVHGFMDSDWWSEIEPDDPRYGK